MRGTPTTQAGYRAGALSSLTPYRPRRWAWCPYVLAAGALGCRVEVPITPDQLRDHVGAEVAAQVGAGGEVAVRLKDARLDGDLLTGTVESCVGPLPERPRAIGCSEIYRDRQIPLAQVRNLTIQKLRPGAVIAGVIVGTAAIAFATVLATRPSPSPEPTQPQPPTVGGLSCPQVESFDGRQWVLDSGTFGGAIFEAAQRTDTDLLEHLTAVDGSYRLRMRDVGDETEHVDALAIEVVDHPAGVRVVPDFDGRLLTFGDIVRPTAVQDLRGADALGTVTSLDEIYWRSDISDRRLDVASDARDGLELTFRKPAGATEAKLLLSGMNTPWSASLVGQFLYSMGPSLDTWYARLNGDPSVRQAFFQFLLREAMLRVDVWTGEAWASRGVFWEAGPEVRKQQAVLLNIADVAGSTFRVRLHAPVGFWSIDEVAVDYGAPIPLRTQVIKARRATTRDGQDVRAALAATEGIRYKMIKGDSAELVFDAPPLPTVGWSRSFVLETTGYYVIDIRPDPRGTPATAQALISTPGLLARESLTGLEWTVARQILQ
jgi:hypothetical protein